MIRTLSPRERRLVAVLILTALLAAAYFLVVGPIAQGFAARSTRRAQLALLYAHNQRTIASIPRMRRQAELQRDDLRLFVVKAKSVEAGREWLKERLQHAVDKAGGEFRDGTDGDGRPGWARARAAARMTLAQLTVALAHLQNEPPWLVIETVSVRANDALANGQSSPLDVEIEVSIPLRPASVR